MPFELGTYDFPFKEWDLPSKEIFNFIYNTSANSHTVNVYIKRGTTAKIYTLIAPIIATNIKSLSWLSYGDTSLA
jgi:hypothetical protein